MKAGWGWCGGDPALTKMVLDRAERLRADCNGSVRAMSEALGVSDRTWRNWRDGSHLLRRAVAQRVWMRLLVMEEVLHEKERALLRRMGRRDRVRRFRDRIPAEDEWAALRESFGIDTTLPDVDW